LAKGLQKAVETYSAPKKGRLDLMLKCRAAGAQYDPEEFGNNAEVNGICALATQACRAVIFTAQGTERSPFDIAHKLPDPIPP
jgi:hypothetical protein